VSRITDSGYCASSQTFNPEMLDGLKLSIGMGATETASELPRVRGFRSYQHRDERVF
jgi:hypothetical protein